MVLQPDTDLIGRNPTVDMQGLPAVHSCWLWVSAELQRKGVTADTQLGGRNAEHGARCKLQC